MQDDTEAIERALNAGEELQPRKYVVTRTICLQSGDAETPHESDPEAGRQHPLGPGGQAGR
jgi:hypothetical protein